MNIGLRDELCPYSTVIPVIEGIHAPKATMICPELGQSPPTDLNVKAHSWLRRYLGGRADGTIS